MSAEQFARAFGRPPTVEVSAPGRVNLMGEHTDYNGGLVLPALIPQRTTVWLAARDDGRVRAHSVDLGLGGRAEAYQLGGERAGAGWIDHVQGVTMVLASSGRAVPGFDVLIASDVPIGAGLSSSAALSVALLRGLRELGGWALDDVALALLAQRSEVELVGAPVGIMDQMASSLGAPGSALFLDTRSLERRVVPLPAEIELVVISSGVAHEHGQGDYRTRRAECERAASLLGVGTLRDLEALPDVDLDQLPAPLDRRVRHVLGENARVLAAVAALEAGDIAGLAATFAASHRSQRDDYQVSVPEIDLLVELATADDDLAAARLTGGGFGGSIVALARPGTGAAAAARIAARYAQESGRTPRILVPAPSPAERT